MYSPQRFALTLLEMKFIRFTKFGMKLLLELCLPCPQNRPASEIRGCETEEEKKNAESMRNMQMRF